MGLHAPASSSMSRKRDKRDKSRVTRRPGTMKQEQKGKEREKITEKTIKLIGWLFGRDEIHVAGYGHRKREMLRARIRNKGPCGVPPILMS